MPENQDNSQSANTLHNTRVLSVKFYCPECRVKLSADPMHFGTPVKCPGCEQRIIVPIPSLQIGSELGEFVVSSWLSKGAMGEIYVAKDSNNEKFAVKILREGKTNKISQQRFSQESQVLIHLKHPNIVKGIDINVMDGMQYFIMEYVNGESLDRVLERSVRFKEQLALKLTLTLAEALDYAWTKVGLIHRDIKPANIMITPDNRVVLMDFGLCKSYGDNSIKSKVGMVVGTPLYICPDQARYPDDVDFRSDIFSLGSMLYHMLTGIPPHDHENPTVVITRLLTEKIKEPRMFNPRISQHCNDLVLSVLYFYRLPGLVAGSRKDTS